MNAALKSLETNGNKKNSSGDKLQGKRRVNQNIRGANHRRAERETERVRIRGRRSEIRVSHMLCQWTTSTSVSVSLSPM